MVGQTVGKYRIVSRLGRGGMGTVYKAVDETLEREVAIKILNPDLADAEVLKRFRAEAVTLARLNHPNIATLYELTQDGGDLLMVMEFVRGETFDRLSDRLGPLAFDRAASLCSQVLDALGHAHRAGIVHRDLKPANLMVAESGIVKVMDFGIARMVGTEHLTIDGYMMGTPAYMAPEQVMGNEVDGRADLYSIGVVLYRLLTANLPFRADTAIAMVQKQIKDPPTPLRQFRTGLPTWCQGILDRALAKAPHERFQTAEEFRAALAHALAPAVSLDVTPPIAIPPSPAKEQSEVVVPNANRQTREVAAVQEAPARRRTGLVLAAAIAAILGLTSVAWILTRHAPAADASTPPTALAQASVLPASLPAVEADAKRASNVTSTRPSARPVPAPTKAKAAAILPPVVFQQMSVLMFDGGKSREHDASVRLADGAVQVLEGDKRVKTAAYSAILAIFHSRSREPRWVTASGAVVSVAKVERRKLSLFNGDRDWLTVRTRSGFIALRADSSAVGRVIAALEARTGLKVIRAR